MKLFYDCETTGLPDFKARSADSKQPHIIQLAAILRDDDGNEVEVMDELIKTDGVVIDQSITELTGITQADIDERGKPPLEVMTKFRNIFMQATEVIGHNESFDARMVRIMFAKLGLETAGDTWKERKAFCTCKASTPIVNLPPTEKMIKAGFNNPKSAKLEEAYKHFYGEDMVGAHDALNDVRATIAVYDKLENTEASQKAPKQELALMPPADMKAADIFKPEYMDGLISKIKAEVAKEAIDISTDKGRKDLKSLGYKISRTKTAIDNIGKAMVAEEKAKLKLVDNERKKCRDALDELKADTLKPLTDFEAAAQARLDVYEEKLKTMQTSTEFEPQVEVTAGLISNRIQRIEQIHAETDWQEFQLRADTELNRAKTALQAMLEQRQKEEAAAAEEQRLAAEKAKKEQEEREAEIARKAKEEAERESEAKVKAAQEEAEKAAEQERKRIADEKAAEEAAAKKRAEDEEHMKNILNAASSGLIVMGIDEPTAVKIIEAIKNGEVPYVLLDV